jgi:glycerol-3-phosphate dehydrogenase
LTERDALVKRLLDPAMEWDLLVIGGGASGLGIALDAVSRGYSVLLVEQSDFAKGTSSRSTKLVHGGVRYLAQGDIRLVREASIERGLLHRNAPHLVRDQTFIIPVYSNWDRIKYTVGLKIYDRIAGKLGLGRTKFVSRDETLRQMPGIRAEGLKGGIRYHDGQFDDSRLAINLAQTINDRGGLAINYMQVIDLAKNAAGKLSGATIVDRETNKPIEIKSKAVVNATGVFVDNILKMDNPRAGNSICVSQGVHLVVDQSFYPSAEALMIPETSDGRVLFAVPWHNKVVLGTTDTPVEEASLEPTALEKEIDFILQTAGEYLTKKPTRKDILSMFTGLRPLAAPAKGEQKTKEISRSHKIIVSPSQLFTILGGKWTTFRKMGEDLVNRVEKELGWEKRKPGTASLPIHGHLKNTNWSDPFYFYGSDAALMKADMNGTAGKWLSENLRIHPQQVRWAVQHEMARTVEDVLSRRTRALILDVRESLRIAPDVAKIMAEELDRDERWQKEQLKQFSHIASHYQVLANSES